MALSYSQSRGQLMQYLDQIGVELSSHRPFVSALTEVLLLESMDSHGLVLQDLADRGLDIRVDLFEELVIVGLFLITLLDMSQPHNELHMFVLLLHVVLNKCASISTPVVEINLGLHLQPPHHLFLPFCDLLYIGLFSPCIFDEILLLEVVDMEQVKLVQLVQEELHRDQGYSKDSNSDYLQSQKVQMQFIILQTVQQAYLSGLEVLRVCRKIDYSSGEMQLCYVARMLEAQTRIKVLLRLKRSGYLVFPSWCLQKKTRLSSSPTPMKFLMNWMCLKTGSCFLLSISPMKQFYSCSYSQLSSLLLVQITIASFVQGGAYFLPNQNVFLWNFRKVPTFYLYFLRFQLRIFWIWVFVSFYFFIRMTAGSRIPGPLSRVQELRNRECAQPSLQKHVSAMKRPNVCTIVLLWGGSIFFKIYSKGQEGIFLLLSLDSTLLVIFQQRRPRCSYRLKSDDDYVLAMQAVHIGQVHSRSSWRFWQRIHVFLFLWVGHYSRTSRLWSHWPQLSIINLYVADFMGTRVQIDQSQVCVLSRQREWNLGLVNQLSMLFLEGSHVPMRGDLCNQSLISVSPSKLPQS